MFSLRRLLLLIACLAVVAAIVAPAALIWSALFTTGGLQFVIRHIPHNIAGVQLDIVAFAARWRRLAVERVEIDHELVHLKFEGIEGRVALMPLLLQTIRATRGSVRSALIE